MRERIITNGVPNGSVAGEYIKTVEERKLCRAHSARPETRPAEQVLRVFEDHNRPLPADAAPPVKGLIRVLTQDMQGIPGLLAYGDGREIGARLFTGCEVRLVGIPERRFVVTDIFWDYESVRLKEVGGVRACYTVPWDCVEFGGE
jgi:hypothetical protein